jgi:hypothetical protein
MPAPLVGAAALAAARLLAAQLAKQGAKKGAVRLSQRAISQAVNKSAQGGRVISRATDSTRNVRRPKGRLTPAEKDKLTKLVSEKLAARNKTQLSRDMTKVKINPASLGSRIKSGKPTPNRGGGLRTTTGQGKKATSRADVYEAVRTMSQRPGGASTTTGTGAVRGTAPKPGVRVTNITGSGTKVTGGIKRTTNKNGSAITIKNKPPMSKEQIEKAQIEKNTAAKIARSIQGGVGKRPTRPGGPKMDEATRIKNRGLAVVSKGRSATKVSGKEEPQGITVRGKLYRDANPGTPARGQSGQGTLEERISSGLERATYGRQGKSNYDAEAENLVNRSIRAIENPKAAAKERVKPGKRTNVAKAARNPKARNVGKAIAKQRKVLSDREIKQAAERSEKTLDAVINKMVKRGASKSEIERVIAAKRKADSIGARVSVPRPRRGR